MKNYILLLGLIVVIALSNHSCTCSRDSSDDELNMPDSLKGKALELAKGQLASMVKNISSPVEIGAMLKAVDAPYAEKYLAPINNIDNYNTSYKRALNLGLLGVDLGYMSMYQKTMSMMNYITSIKKLADNLGVGQFYDFEMLKRLAGSSYNLDSVAFISVESFNKMDAFLHENKRSNISALIVTGLWVESTHLALSLNKDIPNEEIVQRIGEQKIIISELHIILKNFAQDPQFAALAAQIEKIKKVYDTIKITIEYGEPITIEKDGMLMIEQQETSHVEITPKHVKELEKLVGALRNSITQ